MSIEKLDFQGILKERQPFTTFLNHVIQNIQDADSLAVWVYLVSMPPSWNVNKQHLMNHFKMGKRHLEDIFSYLRKTNLIQYIQTRDKDNKIRGWSINVLCGDKFDKDGHLKNEKATPQVLNPVDNSTPQISSGLAFQRAGSDPHINTTMLIKENEKQREAQRVGNYLNSHEASVREKPKPSLFSFEITSQAHEAAAAKGLDLKAMREKFVQHYSNETEFARNWPELFHKWVMSEKTNSGRPKDERIFADVSKQSTSYGAEPSETPEEAQRKWEERMLQYGKTQFGS